MLRETIGLGALCGLLACASEERARTDDPVRSGQQSTSEQDARPDADGAQPASPALPAQRVDAGARADGTAADAASSAYPGKGFVVHEWGTNTVVVGSDGKPQRGMHHEEEDLPAFVYDRLRQGEALAYPSVNKMETPVDYFYADAPLTASVSVSMPNGVLTQWYPAVREFAPPIVEGAFNRPDELDPYLELGLPFSSQHCIDKYTRLSGGRLDWGDVEVLARDTSTNQIVPPAAPLDRFTWAFARDVAANPLRIKNPSGTRGTGVDKQVLVEAQNERFLFYRGLGNFALPTEIVEAADGVRLTNHSPWPMSGPVFLLDVGTEVGAFRVVDGALSPSASVTAALPSAADALPLERFVDALESAMTAALLGTGLYQDEAVAMVRTWRRQWFRTPGQRVLHFAPAAWIDREVPITIRPAPDTLLRVMVLRVELLRRSTEDQDLKFAAALDGGPNHAGAERHFRALGRFAEPRLRRALETLGTVSAAAAGFLAALEHPNASFATE